MWGILLTRRLGDVALGQGQCDVKCHDQLRNTVTVHIRSRHVDPVTSLRLARFRALSQMPLELQTPAYYHAALAQVRGGIKTLLCT